MYCFSVSVKFCNQSCVVILSGSKLHEFHFIWWIFEYLYWHVVIYTVAVNITSRHGWIYLRLTCGHLLKCSIRIHSPNHRHTCRIQGTILKRFFIILHIYLQTYHSTFFIFCIRSTESTENGQYHVYISALVPTVVIVIGVVLFCTYRYKYSKYTTYEKCLQFWI